MENCNIFYKYDKGTGNISVLTDGQIHLIILTHTQ